MKAVTCGTCKMWVHKECEEMSDDLFAVLAAKYGGIMWQCQACVASTARLDAAVKLVEKRMEAVEARMDAAEEREKLVDVRMERVELVADQAKKDVSNAKEDVAKVIFDEMREREDRKLNIILHNVGEAGDVTVEQEKMWDEESFDNVMQAIQVSARFRDCATFSRRLGAKVGERARPLLVGLNREDTRTQILLKSKKLSAATPELRLVSVVPDLTKRQREADEEVRKEAEKKNRDDLTTEEREKNVRWVAVGRKGAKKLVKKQVMALSHPNSSNNRSDTTIQNSRERQHQAKKRQRELVDQTGAAGPKRLRNLPPLAAATVPGEVTGTESDTEEEMDSQPEQN